MRKIPFAIGEFYHVYNRGTDKRVVFGDLYDVNRFLQSLVEFNTPDPIGSLYEHSFVKRNSSKTNSLGSSTSKSGSNEVETERLVNIVAYCLNPNHYHLILEQVTDRGIEKFMQRVGTGYTKYFNNKNERSGVLFQGRFKAVHIGNNEQLLRVSAYVNLNFRVHKYGDETIKNIRSSWDEYIVRDFPQSICVKDSVLGQFDTTIEYMEFAERSLKGIIERKELIRDFHFK